MATDVLFAWLNVHGGAFHKLIGLADALRAVGIRAEILFSAGPPRGLKVGVDVPEALLPELAARGVHFLTRHEVLRRAESANARLLVTDAHHDPDLPGLIAQVRARGVRTAQMATLLGDFACHGAEYLLMQHPLSLFFEMEFSRTRESRLIRQARGVLFTGNLFFDAALNTLITGFASREGFCAKYGFDPARPICLWLPNSVDTTARAYGQVIEAAREAGLNLAVKLHPWEYAWKKHGAQGQDPWGHGRTSDEIWKVRPVDECDSTWAYRYCDLAVMRASATNLELPFWEKPGVLLPSTHYSALVRAQADMVRRCAVVLPGAEALGEFLLRRPLPSYSHADYAAAQAVVRQDLTRDGQTQTVEALARILSAPESIKAPSSDSALRSLYDPHVTPALAATLTPTRRLRYEAGRLLRRLANARPIVKGHDHP